VALTANPLTGEHGEVVITAVRGLGERLVSGAAVGDEWVVRKGESVCRRVDEAAISAEQAADIAALARRVEDHFGSPQDIEWAISGDVLYLLQARPMTALPEPVDWTPPARRSPPDSRARCSAQAALRPQPPASRANEMTDWLWALALARAFDRLLQTPQQPGRQPKTAGRSCPPAGRHTQSRHLKINRPASPVYERAGLTNNAGNTVRVTDPGR
jgi:hypothetical protein